MIKKILVTVSMFLAFGLSAVAQVPTPAVTGGVVVATCGTPPTGYPTTGAIAPQTIDTNGQACAGVTVSVSIGTATVSGNSAASATGSAVPAAAGYTGVNVGGNLVGVTGTGTSMNVNVTGGSATGVAQGSTTSGQTGPLIQCAVTTSAPTYTTAQTNPCSMDTSGNLRITGTVSSGGVAQGSTTSGQTGGLTQAAVTTGAPSYTTAQTSPLSLQTDGALRTATLDGNIVTLGAKADAKSTATDTTSITAMQVLKEISFMEQTPASRAVTNAGTFAVQAAQSGNWTTRTVDASGNAFANNNPIPTRASDGTNFITDAAIGAALSSSPVPIGCHNETSPTTIGNTQVGVPECDTSQRLIVVSPTAGNFLATVNLRDGSGTTISSTSNALNVNCANCSGSGVSTADEAAFTAGSSAFVGVGGFYQTTATSNPLTTGQQGMAQLTVNRAVMTNLRNAVGVQVGDITTPLFTTPTPGTTGGWSVLNATAADGATACTNSAQAVKASAGTFGGYYINNPNTSDEWLQVYDVASGSVSVGTTNPKLTIRLPGAAANSVAANMEITLGLNFGTAIAIACTSTAGGNGAPANALEANIFYK